MNYYNKLKELRIDKDLFQKDIAEILEIDQQYYSQYERGINELPIRHLKTLCLFYGVSADYILGLPEIFSFLIALLIFFVLVTFNKIEIEFLQKYRYLIGVFGILFTTAFIERFARR